MKSDFENISQKWPPYSDDVSRATFGSLPWRSRSQHDLAAKSCPAHNLVFWSWISKLFHINDHHIEMTWCMQHLGCYLEGQGHSMTLQQNRVRPITLLFEVGFYIFFISSPEHEVLSELLWSFNVRRPSSVVHACVRASTISLNNISSETAYWILTKLHRNDP